MGKLYNDILFPSNNYKHFISDLKSFYNEFEKYEIASISNHVLDIDKLGDFRISRFMRDPRDMVVSGYFYHLRGAEKWCHIVDPVNRDWEIINGNVPKAIKPGQSFYTFLNSVDCEEGMIAEIEFRKNHFSSMLDWPLSEPRIKLFLYEDILGNERDVFEEIFLFYGLPWYKHKLAGLIAEMYSVNKVFKPDKHIRNPEPGQWREYFSPKVEYAFNEKYVNLLNYYGYNQIR